MKKPYIKIFFDNAYIVQKALYFVSLLSLISFGILLMCSMNRVSKQ